MVGDEANGGANSAERNAKATPAGKGTSKIGGVSWQIIMLRAGQGRGVTVSGCGPVINKSRAHAPGVVVA